MRNVIHTFAVVVIKAVSFFLPMAYIAAFSIGFPCAIMTAQHLLTR